MTFVETKRHINKPTQTYGCELVKQGKGWVLLHYISQKAWQIVDAHLPKGSSTWAFYEEGASSVIWRMVDPAGQLVGHLFHICSDITVKSNGVDYLDLLLDVWVDAQGHAHLLDADELFECVAQQKISLEQKCHIEALAVQVLDNWQMDVQNLEERLV
ncbi:MAG: DUF402 domain-containing protein [Candidatus Latescibacterota bacterium]|jgi:predicted RNA-binding protein associated with RNAse of E/G family